MSISASNASFNSQNIKIKFNNSGTSPWLDYTDITNVDSVRYFSSSQPGWMDYYYDFSVNSKFMPTSMSYVGKHLSIFSSTFSIVLSSSAAQTYTFKDIAIHFKELLTDYGVKFYKDIDNDNNDEIFSNIGFLGTRVD